MISLQWYLSPRHDLPEINKKNVSFQEFQKKKLHWDKILFKKTKFGFHTMTSYWFNFITLLIFFEGKLI